MSNDQKVKAMVLLWAAVFFGSLFLRYGPYEGGSGFAKGMSRGLGFVTGLFVAGVIALQARLLAQSLPKGGWLRRLGHVPLGVTILVLGLGLIMVFRGLLLVGGGIG
ncbi:MAG: hypothetical protein WBA92_18130 [Pseudorhodobacter sp.]